MCESEGWPLVYPRVLMIQCYENYEVQFSPGELPPRPHTIKFVYDLEGAGIELEKHLKSDITPVRLDEDRLRVIASPPIPKPCTLSVRVVAVAGLSEDHHFSLKFCSPMEYLYHKMRHDPHRESTVAIPKPIVKPLFLASLAYVCGGGTISESSGPVMYDLKQQSGVQVDSDTTLSSMVLGDHSEKNLLDLCKENSWNTLKHQLSSQLQQQQRQQHPTNKLAKPDNSEKTDSVLSDFVESLKEHSLFKATACSDYIRKDQPSWLQLKKGDEVYVVDCTKKDRWYGISANNHGYFGPQFVTREDKLRDNHRKTSQISIDDGFHSRTASINSQANEVYVTMKSVLEALSGKPQIAASPSLQSMAPPTTASSEDHIYDRVPTNRTSTYQPITVTVTTSGSEMLSESNPRNFHYDVPKILNTQQIPVSSHNGLQNRPTPSPRQSPPDNRSHYAVPRPTFPVTVESVYDVPRASNNQPLSPTSASHYDVPRIMAQIPASKSHYDVPRHSVAESLGSPRPVPRTSSNPDLTEDTIKVPSTLPKARTPPVTPRRFGDKAKTLDGKISYKDLQNFNSDVKKSDFKKKPILNKRRQIKNQ